MKEYRVTRRRLLQGMAVAPLALQAAAHAAESSGVAASPSLAAARAARLKLNHKAMEKLGWKLSSQAYTFRELTLFETMDVLNALGLRYIELFPGQSMAPDDKAGFDHNAAPERVAAVQAKLKSAHLTPVNYGVVGLGDDEAENRKVFNFAKTMGMLTIVSEPPEDSFDKIDRLCGEYKINVALHDHPRPSRYWDPAHVLEVVKGHSRRIGSCSDTGHWYRSGFTPLECLKQLEGRIISLHFKDLNAQKEDVPWGTGVCDAREMLKELKRQKFRGVFSAEYERTSGVELVNNVAKSFDWFSRTATELAKSA